MTVQELIEKLKKLPQDMQVVVYHPEAYESYDEADIIVSVDEGKVCIQ